MKALIHENVPLAPLTTFKIGGPARYFIDAHSQEAVLEAIQFAKHNSVPILVLGGGSNLLVADSGFAGLVLKISIRGMQLERGGGTTLVHSGAGEEWDQLVRLCVESELAGIECLSGIPGSVGGTPVQNVGAYGQEISEVFRNLRAYDRQLDQIVELSRDDCGFTYRTSIFNTTAKDRYIVLDVTYSLKNSGLPSIRYPDIQREFQGNGSPTLAEVRAAVRRVRARKAMLLVEGDPDCRSAGSFFRNPIITEREFAEIQSRASGVPRYPASPGRVKTAAAWLIEQAGIFKGYSSGAVGVSTKHTLAIVNKGGARSDDILRLAREIRTSVLDKFGVRLVPEPVFVGFDAGIMEEFFATMKS